MFVSTNLYLPNDAYIIKRRYFTKVTKPPDQASNKAEKAGFLHEEAGSRGDSVNSLNL